jgi:Cu/Ag efflux protein CusF
MRNVSRLLVVLFVLAFASATFAAQAGAPKAAPQEKVFQGTLVKVDADAKTLTAKGEDNKDMVFHYTDKTEVVGAENTVQGLAAKAGTKVNIAYSSQGANNNATRIEVSR